MTDQIKTDDKVEKPATHFAVPHDVVVDDALSSDQKVAALETLEQDARQLSEAASEGMTGGESTNLDEVLDAKQQLVSSAVSDAYQTVIADLQTRKLHEDDPNQIDLIAQALEALEQI